MIQSGTRFKLVHFSMIVLCKRSGVNNRVNNHDRSIQIKLTFNLMNGGQLPLKRVVEMNTSDRFEVIRVSPGATDGMAAATHA